ncbi:MAG TPA: hypothetical protein VFH88_05010, partial [Candidatus Krumholzibacteria bacterium]|nr:hypothetical protein [Candidatus Krumholzibacteria bacterium]
MFTVALAATGMFFVPAMAAKTTTALPPGPPPDATVHDAALLVRHGEPQLALSTLRSHATDTDVSSMTAGLLALVGEPARAESLLTATLHPDTEDAATRFRTQLVRARLLLDAGRAQAALAVIADMDTLAVTPYAGYRDLVAGRAFAALGQYAQAARALERSRRNAPEAIRSDVDEARIQAYRALNQPRSALAVAEEATRGRRDPDAERRLLKMRFDLARETGEDAAAYAAARDLFAGYRRSAEALDCAKALASDANTDGMSDTLLLTLASVLQAQGRSDALHRVLRRLDARTLSATQSESQRLLWGEYHYLRGDYSRAIALARPGYSDAALRRRSMLLMARSFRRVGRAADAAGVYETYARAFPNDAVAAEALYTAASLYGDLRRDADRTRVLDQLRHAYPSTFHGWAASMARVRELEAAGDN